MGDPQQVTPGHLLSKSQIIKIPILLKGIVSKRITDPP